jgi:uncharacterized protein YciW
MIDSAQKQYETRTIERRIDQLEDYARQIAVTPITVREISPGKS